MYCPQRDLFLIEYQNRVRMYTEAVASLRKVRGCELHSEYMVLWTAATNALLACTTAQRQLGCHVVTHGCGMPAFDRDKALSA